MKKRAFLSVVIILLIVVSVLAVVQNRQIKGLKREIGTQVVGNLQSKRLMSNVVSTRILSDGADVLTPDLLLYVNHMAYSDFATLSSFNFLFISIYEPAINLLSETKSDTVREQLIKFLYDFHQDIEEIVDYADEKCRIVVERDKEGRARAFSGDHIRYAALTDENSKVYKDFEKLIETKRVENSEKLNKIRNSAN